MTASMLHTRREGSVLVVTLDRPPVNALDADLLEEMASVFEGEAMEATVHAVVVTAAGRMFVAGADIKGFAAHDPASGPHPVIRLGNDLFNTIEAYPKPVLAAINGHCLGGGNELAMACDLRLASEDAVFGQPEIKLGLVPGWGGLQRLPRLIGRGRALDLLLTGRSVTAHEAHALGLVSEVVSAERLIPRALELAEALAEMAPLAVAATKERVVRGLGDQQGRAIRDDEWAFQELLASEDGQEGIHAFLEKRSPQWRGR